MQTRAMTRKRCLAIPYISISYSLFPDAKPPYFLWNCETVKSRLCNHFGINTDRKMHSQHILHREI